MQRTIISSFATLTLLSGCGAGVNVARFDGTPAAMRGVPYNLPMTAFKITITRTVTKCGAQLEGDIQATVETTRKIDPGQMYTLSSHGFWNTSDIKGTYATDGTTTGLNATSEGQAGQAISDIVSTIATIAPLIAAVGGAGDACQPEIVTAVAEVNGPAGPGAPPGLRKTVETETKELETLTNNLTVLTAQVTALGSAITPQNQTDFWTAIQAVFAKKASLAAHQAQLDKDLKLISRSDVVEWPVASTDLIRDTTNPVALDATFFTSKWANVQKPAEAIRRFDVFLSLEGKADGAPGMAKPGDTIDVKYGVPVRFPATGILHVCTDAPCGTTGSKEIKKVEGPVLQFGRMYMVPVSGKAFRSTSTAIAYDATGNPTSVEVADKTSLISTLTSTAKSAATSIAGIPAAVSAAELARTKAKTDQETAEIALATAQANGATIEQLAPLQAQTALTTAQTAQINAQTALTAAQKVSTP